MYKVSSYPSIYHASQKNCGRGGGGRGSIIIKILFLEASIIRKIGGIVASRYQLNAQNDQENYSTYPFYIS